MILEVATLDVKRGLEGDFERDFAAASRIIGGASGFVSHELQRCVEVPNRYVLLVRWRSLSDHTEGFRKSEPYSEWRRLLHHYYDPFPTVEHFTLVDEFPAKSASGPTLASDESRAGRRPSPTSGGVS